MIGYKFVEFAPTRFWGFLEIDAINDNDKKSVMTNQKKRNMFIVPKNSLVSHQKEFFGILYLGYQKRKYNI
jgi:ribosomal protein S19